MNTTNLVAFLANARSGQFQEVDSSVLSQYGLDESVLHLTVSQMADLLVDHDRQLQEAHQQAVGEVVQLARLKVEQLQSDLAHSAEKLENEKTWADGQIQMLTHRCEQYEAVLPGLSRGNTSWMSFRFWWFVIGALFVMLWAFKSQFAVDSLIFVIGWIAAYSGVFISRLLHFIAHPVRQLMHMPALRCYARRLNHVRPQPTRVN